MLQTETLLVRTKLNKPVLVKKNLVPRPELQTHLDATRELPFVLVSAPAGYGKTTLVNSYLETVDWTNAWLTLDERDSNIWLFSQYFLAAIQSMFPDVCRRTAQLITEANLPPVETLAGIIANEINMIDRNFILVLDDYSCIHDMSVHDLLSKIIYHPPRSMHLIIVSRRDPPLPLMRFRAQGQMAEIRIPDLRFNTAEAAILIRNLVGETVDDKIINSMVDKTEGWVTGLYLVALSFCYGYFQNIIGDKKEISSSINDYILSEVYSHIPLTLQDILLKISILDRFCASLCDAVCMDDSSTFPAISGNQCLDWLKKENLFLRPLDQEGHWYQLHGLFCSFLRLQMMGRYSSEEINTFHIRASIWYSQHQLFDESLYHILAAGDIKAGIQLVAKYLQTMKMPDQWRQLEHLVNLFPTQIIESSPYLLFAKACVMYCTFQLEKMSHILNKIETLLANTETEVTINDQLKGGIWALRNYLYFWKGDYQISLIYGRKALADLPEEWYYLREMTKIQMSEAMQMLGNQSPYASLIDRWDKTDTDIQDQMCHMLRLCSIHWKNADFPGLISLAGNILTFHQKGDSETCSGIGQYLQGIVHYFQNDLGQAEQHFSLAFKQRHLPNTLYIIQSAFGLASVYLAQGQINRSRDVVNEAADYLIQMNDTSLTPLIQAFKADISLSENDLNAAVHWANQFEPGLLPPMQTFYYPHFTQVKILLAQDAEESRKRASDILARLRYCAESSHNKLYLIKILLLETFLRKSSGDKLSALAALEQALSLARENRIIRPFINMGPIISDLLLDMDNGENDLIQQIGNNLVTDSASTTRANNKLVSPLTDRELKVMELLTKRLSNKEIAGQLDISTGTVKSHTIRIYQKLNVKNRRQASEKALALGVIR
jgi:LuxR family transcriptional regulator, maltose regulon positive regulatory protein